MRVAVFGGTGFIGGYIVDALVREGHVPVLLVRPGSERKIHIGGAFERISGDIGDPDAVARTFEGTGAAIYAVGILRERTQAGSTFEELHVRGVERTIAGAARAGIGRFLLVSANGADRGRTAYQRTKLQGEEALRSSDLEWTIFRPSIVYGDPRGARDFMTLIRDQIILSPFPAPLFFKGFSPFNAGSFRFSPVHVADLAGAVTRSIESSGSSRRTFTVGGPRDVDWKGILAAIARVMKRRKLMIPVPASLAWAGAALFESFAFFPASRDELTMLFDGNTCDGREAARALDVGFRGFSPEHLSYLRR